MSYETDVAQFGERLRSAREESRMTLDQVASKTGLSKAHLSRLESGERQPSVAALVELSRALGIAISRLLGENTNQGRVSISTGEEARHEANGLSIAVRSGFLGSSVLEALHVLVSTDRTSTAPASHQGEEWIYVLRGTLLLEYDQDSHILPQGQSVHFDATLSHRLVALDEECEILIVAGKESRSLHSLHR